MRNKYSVNMPIYMLAAAAYHNFWGWDGWLVASVVLFIIGSIAVLTKVVVEAGKQ